MLLAFTLACDRQADSPAEQTRFTLVDGTSAEAVERLNEEHPTIVSQVLERHSMDANAVNVKVGHPSGLGIEVSVEGKKTVRLKVPPASNPAEQITNFDHTLDRALRRAAEIEDKD